MTATWVELSELMVSRAGSVDPKKFADEKFELFSIPAFDRGLSDLVLGGEIGSSKQLVRPGDVMLSKIVPHIRRAWIVPASGHHRQIASGEWILFRSPRFYGPYLRHLLTSDFFNRQFMQTVAGVGGSLLRARPAHVAKIRVPLPGLNEQRRLAAILDKAEELRTTRRQAVSRLDILNQSIFHSMFGDAAYNPQGFPKLELVELCAARDDIRCGPFGTQLNKDEFRSSGVPLWGIKNVNRSFELPTHEFLEDATAERLDSYSILPGDIVMTRKGTVGNCSVYPANFPRGIMHSDLLRLRLNPSIANVRFISDQLHSSRDVAHQVSLISGGAIMAGINVSKLKIIKVLTPPLARQNEYAARVTAVDGVRSRYRAQLAELDALFASLQHRAFQGEL
jgi:type I restriction enzyme S subunit